MWSLLKRQIASEDRLKSKVEELQKEMNDYIKTDLQKVTTALDNNTKVMNDLRDIIIRKNS